MSPIKAILFDLDDTLYPYEENHELALRNAYNYWYELTGDDFRTFRQKYRDARTRVKRFLSDTAASHSRPLYFQTMVEQEFKRSLAYHAAELTARYWDEFIRVIKPFPHVMEFLKRRSEEGIMLGIITNMSAEVQLRKLHALEIDGHFEIMVTSEEVGKEKPHPHIFLHALNKLKIPPQKAIMIGDSYEADYEPAKFLEMQAILLDHRNKYRNKEALRASTFGEIENILRSLKPKDGVIKYGLIYRQKTISLPEPLVQQTIAVRDKLWEMGLIGRYPDTHPEFAGLGYGNVSLRFSQDNQFIVTGSQTGYLPKLDADHVALVTDFDIDANEMVSKGPIKPSSESLTHAAIYEISPETQCVIHIHNNAMWRAYKELKTLVTPKGVEYGTPQMARAVQDAFRKAEGNPVAVIMLGHEDGIITWGRSSEEALKVILDLVDKYQQISPLRRQWTNDQKK
ncbi:MAG: HAD family hydrolase [Methanobacteriota archaeon]|nr:MAG: HAD family hydrolase [Euryarchaeota archaeon]